MVLRSPFAEPFCEPGCERGSSISFEDQVSWAKGEGTKRAEQSSQSHHDFKHKKNEDLDDSLTGKPGCDNKAPRSKPSSRDEAQRA
jgi:hypothetical protein